MMRLRGCFFPGLWTLVGVLWLSALGHAAESIYIVRKKDTLTEIAIRYHVSPSRLAKFNGITRPDRIFPGQKLRIPSLEPGLDPGVLKSISEPTIQARRWKNVVIHHSASASGSLRAFDRYHREERHMENGLAYHFVIGNGAGMDDGEIGVGRRWQEQLDGGHLASDSLNHSSIGICLVGNFDTARPTAKQLDSLAELLQVLLDRCNLSVSAVKSHQKINPVHTRCPGQLFPMKDLVQRLKKNTAVAAR